MKYISIHWFSCHGSGIETVEEARVEEQKEFLKRVFGAYRFEITYRK